MIWEEEEERTHKHEDGSSTSLFLELSKHKIEGLQESSQKMLLMTQRLEKFLGALKTLVLSLPYFWIYLLY